MKQMKRVITLFGVMTLMAASILGGNVAADEIGTTLIVESSTPACTDIFPSRVAIRQSSVTFPSITPTNPPSETIIRQSAAATNVDFNINNCLMVNGNQWYVSVSFSDFTSGDDTVASNGTLYVRGSRGATNNGEFWELRGGGSTSLANVPGTASLMTAALGYVPFVGEPIRISEGTAHRGGGFSQGLQFGIANIPGDTPPGTYTATITATLNVAAP